MKNILYLSVLFFSNLILTQDYHVAKNGDDSNPGTKDKPFLTISKAAKIALPGSVITVHKVSTEKGLTHHMVVQVSLIHI